MRGGRADVVKCRTCGAELDDDALFCPADGTHLDRQPAADPLLGAVIADDIMLTSLVGAGAMGRVYRGHQRGVGRHVAVKVLHRDLSANRQIARRFEREARIVSLVQHPHVVEVYLAGRLADGALYTVMELLDGVSLAGALLAAGGAMPLERALRITMQLCAAVGEAHAHDIVHRDLKPENIMLVRHSDAVDWVKVLDFGIAKGNVDGLTMETAPGVVFGTARYISPEGARGGTVGPASDVYSLATILFEMLAGHPPFVVDSAMALLVKHVHEAPPELLAETRAVGLPAAIARVVMDNLAKNPAHRAPDARAFGSALASAARDAGIALPEVGAVAPSSDVELTVPIVPSSAPPITTLGGTIGTHPPPPPQARWSGRTKVALTLLLGAATTLAAQSVARRDQTERTALTENALRSAVRALATPTGGSIGAPRVVSKLRLTHVLERRCLSLPACCPVPRGRQHRSGALRSPCSTGAARPPVSPCRSGTWAVGGTNHEPSFPPQVGSSSCSE